MKGNRFTRASLPVMVTLLAFVLVTSGFYPENLTSEIQGSVINTTTGKGIPQVRIRLFAAGVVAGQATSDNQGQFLIQRVNPGTYRCVADHPGYKTVVKNDIQVVAVGMTRLALKMEMVSKTKITENTFTAVEHLALEKEDQSKVIINNHAAGRDKKETNQYHQPASSGNISYDQSATVWSREGYDYLAENEFNPAMETPLSTFSIDVDRASYSNVRRFLNKGSLPPIDAVRVEEMINYFTYDYAQPKNEHPFAIHTEVMDCPWNKDHQLALIGLQGKNISTGEMPPANLVFLVDVSGSMMSEDKLPLLKRSLALLVNELRENDRVALVVYAGNAGLALPSTSGRNKEKIMEAIGNLEAGGSTAGGAGINLAYQVAQSNFTEEGSNRVILATDGDFNVGVSSDGELVRMIEEKRKGGIFLTVLGFGTGNYQDAKMEKLADKGNGNYAYIDNIMEAQKTLVNEMGGTLLTIAKDVKLQVEFNPAQVKEYKLIGYENRLLHDRDFNDDTKDAGELGSGHTVTALYEIVPADARSTGASVDPLKYQMKDLAPDNSLTKDLFTVKFRYKNPDGDKSKLLVKSVKSQSVSITEASVNMRFAASVAAFGLLLRNSKFKGEASYQMVQNLASTATGKDPNGYRSEFLRLVETARVLSKNTARE